MIDSDPLPAGTGGSPEIPRVCHTGRRRYPYASWIHSTLASRASAHSQATDVIVAFTWTVGSSREAATSCVRSIRRATTAGRIHRNPQQLDAATAVFITGDPQRRQGTRVHARVYGLGGWFPCRVSVILSNLATNFESDTWAVQCTQDRWRGSGKREVGRSRCAYGWGRG